MNFKNIEDFCSYAADKLENTDAVGVGLGSKGKRLLDGVCSPYTITGYFYDADLHLYDDFSINKYLHRCDAERDIGKIREILNL